MKCNVGKCGDKYVLLEILWDRTMFTGTITARLDAKGRVFLPSEFRRRLADAEAGLMLRRDIYQPCLVIYPAATWQAEVAALRARLNRWDPVQAMVYRRFLSDVEPLTLDANGRVLLSRRMQELCHIGKSVCFVGADDRIEVWDEETMRAQCLTDEQLGEKLAQLLAGPAT